MAYEFHIVRNLGNSESGLIDNESWQAAVHEVADVRLARGGLDIRNPKTGEVIKICNSGGDAEWRDPVSGDWLRAFRWSERRISFRAPASPADPIMAAARALAGALGASIVGDEGEIIG